MTPTDQPADETTPAPADAADTPPETKPASKGAPKASRATDSAKVPKKAAEKPKDKSPDTAEKPAPVAKTPRASKPASKSASKGAPKASRATDSAKVSEKAAEKSEDKSPDTAEKPVPVAKTLPPDVLWWRGTGRRKTAVARVRIRPGDGKFVVNRRPYDSYFTEERDHKDLMTVLSKTNTGDGIDIYVNVRGGGYTGQAGAIILGLGRALRQYDESLEPILRDNGFLSRDPRKVERKKYGQPGARKRFQFSKR